MRVVQLGPYPPPHGGVASNLVAIHRALRERGVDARVISITSAPPTDVDGVSYPRNAAEVLVAMIRARADVLHIHIGGQLSARLLGLCLTASLIPSKTRTVLTFHSGGFATSRRGRRARRFSLAGFIFRRFDRVIAVSDEIAELFRRYGVRSSRLRVIPPHALDVTEIETHRNPSSLADPILRFFDAHSPVLVTVGGLEPQYGIDFQVGALPKIREVLPQAGLIIIGAGPLRDQLQSTIRQSVVREHALLCGDLAHAATLRVIRRSDALLRTTQYDGDSIAVREALALGTPVVATDVSARPPGVHLFTLGDEAGFLRAVQTAVAAGRVPPEVADHGSVDPVIALYGEILNPSANRRLTRGPRIVDEQPTESSE